MVRPRLPEDDDEDGDDLPDVAAPRSRRAMVLASVLMAAVIATALIELLLLTPEEESQLRRHKLVARIRHRLERKLLPMLAVALVLVVIAIWIGRQI